MSRSIPRTLSALIRTHAHTPLRSAVLRARFLRASPSTPTRHLTTSSSRNSHSSSSSSHKTTTNNLLRSLPWTILLPLLPILLTLIEHTPYEILWVSGPSMAPSFNESYNNNHLARDVVLVRRRREAERLQRGMVVIFRSPMDAENVAVKRVLGVGGDRVTIRPGGGRGREGRYVETRGLGGKETVVVPWNHVWVEGDADDSRVSMDSNVYGVVSENLVTGVVVAVLGREGRWVDWRGWEESEVGRRQRERVEKGAVRVYEPEIF